MKPQSNTPNMLRVCCVCVCVLTLCGSKTISRKATIDSSCLRSGTESEGLRSKPSVHRHHIHSAHMHTVYRRGAQTTPTSDPLTATDYRHHTLRVQSQKGDVRLLRSDLNGCQILIPNLLGLKKDVYRLLFHVEPDACLDTQVRERGVGAH